MLVHTISTLAWMTGFSVLWVQLNNQTCRPIVDMAFRRLEGGSLPNDNALLNDMGMNEVLTVRGEGRLKRGLDLLTVI